jgi:flagellar basal-body rod protein FlgG
LQFTGVDLDLAVEGGAFFVVQTPSGETAYSRNGHLTRSPDGSILSASGTKVLGEKGPLRVPADAAKITVDAKGMVFADGAPVDRLRLVEFPAGAPAPRLVGGGILLGQEGGEPIPSQQMVRQGYFERSNVNVVEEMVRLVESTRSMESYQKMAVAASDETTGQLVRQTGRVA